MNGDESRATDSNQRPWQPRFGLATMLLIMLVCCMMAAAGYYLMQALQTGTSVVAFFVIFTLVAPILLLVGLSGSIKLLNWLRRNSRR